MIQVNTRHILYSDLSSYNIDCLVYKEMKYEMKSEHYIKLFSWYQLFTRLLKVSGDYCIHIVVLYYIEN